MDHMTFLSLKQLRISLINFNISSQVDLLFLNPYGRRDDWKKYIWRNSSYTGCDIIPGEFGENLSIPHCVVAWRSDQFLSIIQTCIYVTWKLLMILFIQKWNIGFKITQGEKYAIWRDHQLNNYICDCFLILCTRGKFILLCLERYYGTTVSLMIVPENPKWSFGNTLIICILSGYNNTLFLHFKTLYYSKLYFICLLFL